MKKSILLLVVLLSALALQTNAQTYEQNKLKYSDQYYSHQKGDPYDPVAAGVCSALIPGLGQMLCDEPLRGLAFMGGEVGCGLVFFAGGLGMIYNLEMQEPGASMAWLGVSILGMAGASAIHIWGIVDAVKVAKINNLYYRDLHRTSLLKLEVSPYVSQLRIDNQQTTPVGMTLRVKF